MYRFSKSKQASSVFSLIWGIFLSTLITSLKSPVKEGKEETHGLRNESTKVDLFLSIPAIIGRCTHSYGFPLCQDIQLLELVMNRGI